VYEDFHKRISYLSMLSTWYHFLYRVSYQKNIKFTSFENSFQMWQPTPTKG
jgi:hypothetical protein